MGTGLSRKGVTPGAPQDSAMVEDGEMARLCEGQHCHESENLSVTKTRANAGAQGAATNLMRCHKRTGEGRLVTWDPGGKPAGEKIVETKGPIEANKNDAAGIDTHNKTRKKPWPYKSQVSQVIPP